MKYTASIVFLVASTFCFAQHQISGVVTSAESGEPLPAATVLLLPNELGMATDTNGSFSFSNVEDGKYVLKVSYVGYKSFEQSFLLTEDKLFAISLATDTRMTDEVIVQATRVSEKSPTSYSNIDKSQISKQNFGQDLPFVLNWSPSVVTTSDAGAGVGYTGMRIRGSDATRINVTINGIPFNDSESQGVFWVDVPDIATSTQSIQVQRGVGSSTNGAGAFGATINLQTNTRNEEAYADVINTYGSFNTHRHTVGFGSGLINDKFIFDGRASIIKSDGFIDRASSDLKSYYFSGGYFGKNTILKAVVFGGREVTYQSWYGVPESRLNNNQQGMLTTAAIEGWTQEQTDNLLSSGSRTFNYYTYDNQVDDYSQDHYQLHFSQRVNSILTANAALHYTYGRGFYEEFKNDQAFADYGLSDIVIGTETVTNTDLVRRRWLDNDFYGVTYSLNYDGQNFSSTLGGAWNQYDGNHFGEIIWAEVSPAKDFKYYSSDATKNDFNIYWKTNYNISSGLTGFADLQFRSIKYQTAGVDNDLSGFDVNTDFNFFNPKLGLTYDLSPESHAYASLSVGQREPVRSDFIDAPQGVEPKAEELTDVEAGWRLRKHNYSLNINYYFMNYKNQLVLTGELNDVGAAIRTNVDKSYRTGVEFEGGVNISSKFKWMANVTLSQNKIQDFTEVLYDYGLNYDEYNEVRNDFHNTDISFSPNVIAGSSLSYFPFQGAELTLLTKYVGGQFLDNTSDENRMIDSYFINDLRLSYSLRPSWVREINLSVLINNILNAEYSSNGYTYGFIGGGDVVRQNYYYPQAGRNFMVMASVRF